MVFAHRAFTLARSSFDDQLGHQMMIEPQLHLAEISTILAAGLLRLRSRKSSPNSTIEADSSLDCRGQSGGDMSGKIEVSRP